MQQNALTLKQIQLSTGCPPYVIKYLADCNRLPVIQKSKGRGYPRLYHSDAIDIIKDHMVRRSNK